ncbi:MAG: fumarate reductase/succinate dehydrogenase flavoprotein [Polaromonas sp.]|nr:fumarate reductase/succinate dehydrogenase flavoprotein [Polaromonas sp.]
MAATIVTGTLPPDAVDMPVAIVGAGVCGLVAALTLRDSGIDCVLLERDASPSGSSALSSGFIPAAGTRVQRAAGVEDSVDLFASDIRAKTRGTAAEHLVQAYARAVGPALDRLQAAHAIEFEVLDGFLYPGHSVRRMHAVRERSGLALMAQLERAATAAGVTIITESVVRELWLDAGGVPAGLGYERPDGRMEHLACNHILLACNGFGGNAAMVSELLPEMRDAIFAGHAGNDGSAIAWGRQLGARLADLGGYQGHGSWAVPQGALVSWALMMEGGVQINARGERFHDETHGYSEASVKVLAQPGGIAWNVFDQPILDLARTFPDFCEAEAAGALRTCVDTAALAALISCPVQTLDATLAAMSCQAPDAHGRVFRRALQAPFFAVKVTGALFHTQGGLDIDEHCRVLREDGSAFSNLLAAGGAARGVSGNAVWGYLSGNGLLSAVAGGAIAAHTIIRSHKETA